MAKVFTTPLICLPCGSANSFLEGYLIPDSNMGRMIPVTMNDANFNHVKPQAL